MSSSDLLQHLDELFQVARALCTTRKQAEAAVERAFRSVAANRDLSRDGRLQLLTVVMEQIRLSRSGVWRILHKVSVQPQDSVDPMLLALRELPLELAQAVVLVDVLDLKRSEAAAVLARTDSELAALVARGRQALCGSVGVREFAAVAQ